MINPSTAVFQSWKLLNVALSFSQSFSYSYIAAFMLTMSDEQLSSFSIMNYFYTAVFIFDMILNFFVEYEDEQSGEIERDLKMIAKNYINGMFFVDLLANLPLYTMFGGLMEQKYAKLWYLVKVVRLINGFKLLDYQVFMK